jgi:hypothetical protein
MKKKAIINCSLTALKKKKKKKKPNQNKKCNKIIALECGGQIGS